MCRLASEDQWVSNERDQSRRKVPVHVDVWVFGGGAAAGK